jgi:hypothetical protein
MSCLTYNTWDIKGLQNPLKILMVGPMKLNTMMNYDLKHTLKYKDMEYRCLTHV